MEDLLTPVSRTYRKADQDTELLTIVAQSKDVQPSRAGFKGTSPEEALKTLKSQPSYDELISVLKYLRQGSRGNHGFNILQPSPQGAQIVHLLVTEIVPNYWTVIKEGSSSNRNNRDLDLLLGGLLSVAGINAILAFLKALLQQIKNHPKDFRQSQSVINIGLITDVTDHLLRPQDQVQKIWRGVGPSDNNSGKARVLRQEFVSLVASGKIVSLFAEAEAMLRSADKLENPCWLADSKKYLVWLGNNLTSWIKTEQEVDTLKLCADLFTRLLKMGHADTLVQLLFRALLLQDKMPQVFSQLLDNMPQLDQRKVLGIIMKLLASQLPNESDESVEDYPLIWAAAGVVSAVVASSEFRKNCLVAWLTDATGAGLGDSCGIRRAALAVLDGDKERLTNMLEKSLNQFGDQLYVKHSPMLQQEAHAQVLLLSAGYVHRISPIKLTILLRTGSYLNAISNRIDASQERAKFLGMVVGEALSSMVHGGDQKLDFKMDEMGSEEAKWYKSLVHVSDKIGPISPLKRHGPPEKPKGLTKASKAASRSPVRPLQLASKPGFVIEEIEEDEEEGEEEDDLDPYAKPDSDAEDSDDDPTLINRDKPKAPVYIRDLIVFLRDSESYDRQKLALATAPVLVRRKASYGTEVSSHAEELATLLVGLADKYDLDNFDSMRQQGMVAVIVAQPQKMGHWFAKTFFDGDYSLSQRASILIALGLSGREIAGYETSDYAAVSSFPTKQLLAKTEKHYIMRSSSNSYTSSPSSLKMLPTNALDNISMSLSQTFLAPLAAEAADAVTGPDALKLSTFTSRLQDPSKVKSKPVTKTVGIKSIPNTTAQLIATSFFFPLTSRFLAALHSPTASMRGILFQPYLLTVYLKTLALLLHAAGPSTLALPQMISELWDLLLGVRGQCVGEQGITHAVLFGLMALLDVNENDMRGLCERHGREIVESVEWVSGVFDRTRGGDQGGDGEENQVKMMAAGILIRLREAVERYRGLLMSDLMGVT